MKKLLIILALISMYSCTIGGNEEIQPEAVVNDEIVATPEEETIIGENEEIMPEEEVIPEDMEKTSKKVEIMTRPSGKDIIKEKIEDDTVLNNISLIEVQRHSTNNDCHTIIDGKVYDITSFFGKHKGGNENLMKLCGKDGSKAFNSQHGENEKAKMTRDSFYIGEFQ